MYARFFSSLVVGMIVVALVAQAAVAAGEPKNEWPFTRSVQVRTTQAAPRSTPASRPLAAEPKNEAPFVRQGSATQAGPVGLGEAKNELPFTRGATPVTSGNAGTGFSWSDASLGLLAGIALTLAAVGGAMATRQRIPRPA